MLRTGAEVKKFVRLPRRRAGPFEERVIKTIESRKGRDCKSSNKTAKQTTLFLEESERLSKDLRSEKVSRPEEEKR